MLPILLTNNSKQLSVLIVGAGRIALRRTLWLLSSGVTSITIIASEFSSEFADLFPQPEMIRSDYYPQDLQRYSLVLACTDDPLVNSQVEYDARKSGVLINRSDNHKKSDFYIPATIASPDITIAINTGNPAFTRELKQRIEQLLTTDTRRLGNILSKTRKLLQENNISAGRLQSIMQILNTEEAGEKLLNSETEELNNPDFILKLYNELKK